MKPVVIGKNEIAMIKIKAKFFSLPLGSLTKTELEAVIIEALITCGTLSEDPAEFSAQCKVTPEKAWRYLRDYHLRSDQISDTEAKNEIVSIIRAMEPIRDGNYFSLHIKSPRLKIWIDRELMKLDLLQGESFRHSVLKITGLSLCKILYGNGLVKISKDDIKKLAQESSDKTWAENLNKVYKSNGISLSEFLSTCSNSATVLQAMIPLVPSFIK